VAKTTAAINCTAGGSDISQKA